jgi:protein involved in polysaccharide export with SLBB domain
MRVIVVSFAVLAVAGGCATQPATPLGHTLAEYNSPQAVRYSNVRPEDLIPPTPGDYRVRPGDVLELRVMDLVAPGIETVKSVRVSGSGTISLPLIPPIPVAGLTEAEINDAVDRAIRESNFQL